MTWNPETQGGHPRMFDPQTWTDPEKQNPNQPQRQPILNFTLKIPEIRGGRPQNIDTRTRPDPEKQNPNQPQHQLILNLH